VLNSVLVIGHSVAIKFYKKISCFEGIYIVLKVGTCYSGFLSSFFECDSIMFTITSNLSTICGVKLDLFIVLG